MDKAENLLTLSGHIKIRQEAEEIADYRSTIPQAEIREGRYLARFAKSLREIEAALKLRFEVFNLELGKAWNRPSPSVRTRMNSTRAITI